MPLAEYTTPSTRLRLRKVRIPHLLKTAPLFGLRRPAWFFVSRMGGGAFPGIVDSYAPGPKAPPRIRQILEPEWAAQSKKDHGWNSQIGIGRLAWNRPAAITAQILAVPSN